jgi:hypothetical protein
MIKIILGIILGITLGILASYFITKMFHTEPIPNEYVRVTVLNKSGQKIKTLILKHERGSIEMKDLSDRESVILIFKNIGENSYRIIAKLDNDSIVSSRGEYIESGYRRTETIFCDSIETYRNEY